MIRAAAAALLLAAGSAVAQPYPNAPRPVPVAPEGVDATAYFAGCLAVAGAAHDVSPSLLLIILQVEGGTLGRVTPNASGAPPDIGPMQVNAIWLPRLQARWGLSRQETYLRLRDNLCANLEAGAWILRSAMDSAPDDFWRGMAHYHSRTPRFRDRYIALMRQRTHALLRAAQAEPRPEDE